MNLLLSDTNRSLIYIDSLLRNKIKIKKIFYYSKEKGLLHKYLKKKNLLLKTKVINSNDINNKLLHKQLKLSKNDKVKRLNKRN